MSLTHFAAHVLCDNKKLGYHTVLVTIIVYFSDENQKQNIVNNVRNIGVKKSDIASQISPTKDKYSTRVLSGGSSTQAVCITAVAYNRDRIREAIAYTNLLYYWVLVTVHG